MPFGLRFATAKHPISVSPVYIEIEGPGFHDTVTLPATGTLEERDYTVSAATRYSISLDSTPVMVIVVGAFSIIAIVRGVFFVYLGASGGNTEMDILGAKVTTSNAGVAAIVLGEFVLLFTFRRIAKAIERLAGR